MIGFRSAGITAITVSLIGIRAVKIIRNVYTILIDNLIGDPLAPVQIYRSNIRITGNGHAARIKTAFARFIPKKEQFITVAIGKSG